MTDLPRLVGTVHHVSFRVDDMAEAVQFYEGVLGCRRIPRPDIPGPAGAWMQAGATQVHLTEYPAGDGTGTPPSEIIPYACHVAFHVDDLDGAEAALRATGLEVVRGTAGVDQIFVRDPSGNLIELSPY